VGSAAPLPLADSIISHELIIYGARLRLPPACVRGAPGKSRGATGHPSLQPGYSSLHSDEKSLETDELPLLIQEIAIHQQELREGHIQVYLGTLATSRRQQIWRRGVPSHRGGRLAPPPDTAPRYAAQHTGSNSIGARGCEHLQKGKWDSLQELSLGNPAITKETTRSGTKAAGSSARCSWASSPVFTFVVMA
jgi:hypothetical protein